MTDILVTGGAGYIGAHTCLDLTAKGYRPIVYDNLVNGHAEFVRGGVLEKGDIRDRRRLDEVLRRYRPAAIVHFAALIEVGQSVRDPLAFFETNVAGTINLLAAAEEAGVDKFVFSSTCATYGIPTAIPMAEDHRQAPINPYGQSKLIVERILADLGKHKALHSVVLRYFNAAGADPQARIGEWHSPETHVVPLAIEAALGQRAGLKVFGRDYDTRDGTCVRDFVHVMDLADAHSRAVEHLLSGGDSVALNLGTGRGTTIQELLAAIEKVAGRPVPVEYALRREGDPPALVADNAMAREVLGWSPSHDLASIIETAWKWHARRNNDAKHPKAS